MRPDQAVFLQHITAASFQSCIDRGMWGLADENSLSSTWPYVVIWVEAKTKQNAPDQYYFKFLLDNYPVLAPTACPWNFQQNVRLDNQLWPRGGEQVNSVFKPGWNPNALYAPCDRIAMQGHDAWAHAHPDYWWKPTMKIDKYLHFVHRLLNSNEYVES